MQYRVALACTLVLLVLLGGPALMSAAWTNAGMLTLRDALLAQADLASGTYPARGALPAGAPTVQATQYLRRAVALDGDNLAARWALGRTALAVGDVETAAGALKPLMEGAGHNPLLYHDALTAFSYGGRPEEVTALYELAPPPQRTQTITDAVVLAYLEGSREAGEQGGRGALERVQELRPGDLYANYFLWKQAHETGDAEAAAVYSHMLTCFPLEAVHPADERLLDYAAEIIPALLEDGLWDHDKTLNVVSFLVWQHHGAPGVERLLQRLIERYPAEPDWLFYLAQLYHRRGDGSTVSEATFAEALNRAEAAYRQVLAVDPEYAQAYLRLGMLYEAWAKGRMREQEDGRQGNKGRYGRVGDDGY
jgi:tetratricopeptide (TPR) repeat protein